MSNTIATESEANDWNSLLHETRLALSTLRVQDLEELAARAQCMLIATRGQDCIPQCLPGTGEQALLGVTREHHLLSALLTATDKNLEVLRRLRGYGGTTVGEVNSRWVR